MREIKRKYFVDGEQVPKQKFYKSLKSRCYKTKDTEYVNGFGIDFDEFDVKEYQKQCRNVNKYDSLIFCGGTFKNHSFRIEKKSNFRR